MLRKIAGGCLLIGFLAGMASAQAFAPLGKRLHLPPTDVALTYNAERGKVVSSNCGCFWFQGAGGNVDATLWHGLGIAANISGGRASDITPGVSLNKVNYLFGPRYTWQPSRLTRRLQRTALFGEFLFGVAHAYGTVLPGSASSVTHANAFALQSGGGANLWLTQHFGIRLIELDYVYSQFSNSGSGSQNDFRFATGLAWRFP